MDRAHLWYSLVLRLIASVLSAMTACVFCSECYQMANLCPRANDDTRDCAFKIANPSALRLASGNYAAQLAAASTSLVGITPVHLDRLFNYTAPDGTSGTLTAAEQTVYDSRNNDPEFDALTYTNLHDGLSLGRKRPALFEGIRGRMESILGAASQAQSGRIEAFVRLVHQAMEKKSEIVATTTSTSYKETTFPIYQLWISVSKKALQGQELAEEVDAKTLFDPTIGKTLVPFEKVQKFKTPAHLFRAFAMFKEAMTVLYNLAPRAWSGFEAQVYRTEASCGFALTQQYVGEVMRRLDQKDYPNIGALMAAGEHNRILDDLRPPLMPISTPQDTGGGSGKRIKLGAVTKQGEFASLIKDKEGKPLVCNQFKNGEPCKAGVASGQGHDQQVGKCAYHHP